MVRIIGDNSYGKDSYICNNFGINHIGGFSIFQDVYEISPAGMFSYTYHFQLGIILVIGSLIAFIIIRIRNKLKHQK